MQDMHSIGGGGRFFIGSGGGAGGGESRMRAHHQHQAAAAKCPRCDSVNTKFCYYNNYNLSQPRHFCKSCRRYWTKGGVLRNVPVGGGCRKSKLPAAKQNPQLEDEAGKTPVKIFSERKAINSSSSSDSSSLTASASAFSASVSAFGASAYAKRSPDAVSDLLNAATDSVSASERSCVSAFLNGTSDSKPDSASASAFSASASASVSGFANGTGNSKPYGNKGGIQWTPFMGQASSTDGGIFPEMGSFTSLITTSSSDTTAFGLGCSTVNLWQQRQNEGLFDDHPMEQVNFGDRSCYWNGGFGPLNWLGTSEDQGLFDLLHTVDYSYWSQSQWYADEDQHNPLLAQPK